MPGSPPRVFLSYARTDGEAFATALRRRLATEEPEITLWQDRAELEGGVGWWTQVEAALDRVKFLIIVLTPGAIASEITRREWRYARERGVIVYPVKGVPDDVLNYTALPKWMQKAHWFDLGRFTGETWTDVKEWQTFVHYLKSDRQPVRVPFMVPDLPAGFVPRAREFREVLQRLLEPAQPDLVAITTALHGAGGYGKTTLAIAVCHDDRVIDRFDDGVLWTSLGQTPRLVEELGRLYEALTGERPAFFDTADAAAKLRDKLEHRHCLLVIDDVWERRHLEPFLKGGPGCVRLVTTRRFDLAGVDTRIRVDEMSVRESVRVLKLPFPPGSITRTALAPLARRLGQWPLLLTLAVGQIRKRLDRGDSAAGALVHVERALAKRGVTAFDQRDAAQREDAVRRTVSASVDQLFPEDRRRALELAIFPEETSIPLTTLERLWALDDLDTVDCAQRLDDVSLLSLDLRRGAITLHHVMREYLQHELLDSRSVHARLVARYGDLGDLPDAFAWRWAPYHLQQAGETDTLRALLLRPEWLSAKTRVLGAQALLGDFELARGDRDIEIVQAVWRLALPVLVEHPEHLSEQLLGRLPVGYSQVVDGLRHTLAETAPRPRLHARWPSLQGPGGGLIQTLTGHEDRVNGALIASDGRLFSWSDDRTLRVWDLATGRTQALTGHQDEVKGAVRLTAGRVLSWSTDGTLRVWDLTSGKSRVLSGHAGPIGGAVRLPAGRALSWSADATLRVWDLTTGKNRVLVGHTSTVAGARWLSAGRALSWSHDATLRIWDLATGQSQAYRGHNRAVTGALRLEAGAVSWGDDGTLRVWDFATGESLVLAGHEKSVTGALILTDRRALSWSSDGTLRVWDLRTGDSRALVGHDSWVKGALRLSQRRVLSWSIDGTLRIWDLRAGTCRVLKGHEGSVAGALELTDGRVLSHSMDGTLRVWDLAIGTSRVLTGHENWVGGSLALKDGRALSWSADGTLRVWDLGTGAGTAPMGHEAGVLDALLLPDGRIVSWSWDATLRVWDLATGEREVLVGHTSSVGGALLLRDKSLLSWSWDGTLRIWDLETGNRRALVGHTSSVEGALVLPNERVLSWSWDCTLRIWELATADCQVLTGHETSVSGALLLKHDRVLSWSSDGSLRVWELTTGEHRVLAAHADAVNGAVRLPAGGALSWSADGTLRVWNLDTGEGRTLTGHLGSIRGVLLLPDRRALSWSDDGTLLLWDLDTGQSRALASQVSSVRGALLLPDRRVLSWSDDGTLRIWDLVTTKRRVLAGHDRPVVGAALLEDGRVLSWSDDRTVRVWHVNQDAAVAAFHFDAAPTIVVPDGRGGLFVGDKVGRVHCLEIVDRSNP